MNHRSEIAYKQQSLVLLLCLSHENGNIFGSVVALNPLKSLGMVIHLAQGRILTVHLVEDFHILLHLAVNGIFQKVPLQLLIFIPLIHLAEVLSHKQQLLAGMAQHKAIGCPQVGEFLLKGSSRHLVHHGTFSVHHLIVGEYQDEILAVGVNHAEGQLSVVVVAEVGVALHIAQEVVHPAHIPLIVKAQAVLLHVSGDLRPGRRLLGNENRAVFLLLENGV